jgi:hypothetical protein
MLYLTMALLQACLTFNMVLATWVKFGLRPGNNEIQYTK